MRKVPEDASEPAYVATPETAEAVATVTAGPAALVAPAAFMLKRTRMLSSERPLLTPPPTTTLEELSTARPNGKSSAVLSRPSKVRAETRFSALS